MELEDVYKFVGACIRELQKTEPIGKSIADMVLLNNVYFFWKKDTEYTLSDPRIKNTSQYGAGWDENTGYYFYVCVGGDIEKQEEIEFFITSITHELTHHGQLADKDFTFTSPQLPKNAYVENHIKHGEAEAEFTTILLAVERFQQGLTTIASDKGQSSYAQRVLESQSLEETSKIYKDFQKELLSGSMGGDLWREHYEKQYDGGYARNKPSRVIPSFDMINTTDEGTLSGDPCWVVPALSIAMKEKLLDKYFLEAYLASVGRSQR